MTRFWLRLINSSELRRSRTIGRRLGLIVLVSFAVAVGLLVPDQRTGIFGMPAALIVSLLFLVAAAAFCAPVLVIQSTRRSRRAGLLRSYPLSTSFPVLLVPATRSFLTAEGAAPLSYLVESVEVVVAPTNLEFWLGGTHPHLARSIPYEELNYATSGVLDSYSCVELRLKQSQGSVPLLLAGPLLGINQAGVASAVAHIDEAITNDQVL